MMAPNECLSSVISLKFGITPERLSTQILMNEIPKKYPRYGQRAGHGDVHSTNPSTSFAYIMNYGVCSDAVLPYQGRRTTAKMAYNVSILKL